MCRVRIFYHQGECVHLVVPAGDTCASADVSCSPATAADITAQLTQRLAAVTNGAHTQVWSSALEAAVAVGQTSCSIYCVL